MKNLPELLAIVGLVPVLWSLGVFVIQKLAAPLPKDDFSEKAYLAAMLAAPVLGLVWSLFPAAAPSTPLPLPEWIHGDILAGDTPGVASADGYAVPYLQTALILVAVIYFAGLIRHTFTLGRSFLKLFQLERSSRTSETRDLLITPHRISAFATLSGKIIVSEALYNSLSDVELTLIRQHELCHIVRKDPLWFSLLAGVDCLFWFNPVIRHQTERCRMAAEIACDHAALKAAPEMRGVYARSLVSALKHTAGNALHCVPAAFSKPSKGDYRMRMTEIMRPSGPVSKSARTTLVAGLSLLIIPVGLIQVAIAETSAIASSFQMTFWPIDGKLTSKYGERIHPVTKEPAFHRGVDWGAAKGTPVKVVAAGTVIRAEFDEGYGNIIDVDHGNDVVTRYSQLDSLGVSTGETVSTGQIIGKVGASGRYATGPHLHFEILQSGAHRDPADYFKG